MKRGQRNKKQRYCGYTKYFL